MNKKVEQFKKIADKLFEQKRYFEAAKLYDLLVRKYEQYQFAFELARCFFMLDQPDKAIYFGTQWLDKIKDNDTLWHLYELLAFAAMKKEDYLKVNEYFAKALQCDVPEDKKINISILYAISFDQIGQPYLAINVLEDVKSTVDDAAKLLEIYLNLIDLYIRTEQLEKALKYIDEVLESYDEFEERFAIFVKKIDIYLRLRRIEEAQKLILAAREYYEEGSFAYEVLHKLLLRSYTIQNEINKGINEYRKGGYL